MDSFFPEIITKNPKAEIPVEGVQSYLLQTGNQQLIFMEFDSDVEIPSHSHEAQWGVVLDGIMELTIGNETRRLHKGDTYFIERGIIHSVKIFKGYKDLTIFDERNRYQVVG